MRRRGRRAGMKPFVAGLVVYVFYSRTHSRLAKKT